MDGGNFVRKFRFRKISSSEHMISSYYLKKAVDQNCNGENSWLLTPYFVRILRFRVKVEMHCDRR